MNTKISYKGYLIMPVNYQDTRCYTVQQPNVEMFQELAASLATAKKWIDRQRAKEGNK